MNFNMSTLYVHYPTMHRTQSHDRCRSCKSTDYVVDHAQAIRVCLSCYVTRPDVSAQMTFDQSQAMSGFDPRFQQPSSFISGTKRCGIRLVDKRARHDSKSATAKRMTNVLKFLETHCEKLGCSEMVRQKAVHYMYEMIRRSEMKRVKKDELLSIVSVCIAAREHRLTYTFSELADVCDNVRKKDICKCYKIYQRVPSLRCAREPAVLADMVPRYCSKLMLEFKQEKRVRKCVRAIDKDCEMRTMNPLTKLAVAINVATDGDRVSNISVVCGVSEHTITRSTVRYQAKHQ